MAMCVLHAHSHTHTRPAAHCATGGCCLTDLPKDILKPLLVQAICTPVDDYASVTYSELRMRCILMATCKTMAQLTRRAPLRVFAISQRSRSDWLAFAESTRLRGIQRLALRLCLPQYATPCPCALERIQASLVLGAHALTLLQLDNIRPFVQDILALSNDVLPLCKHLARLCLSHWRLPQARLPAQGVADIIARVKHMLRHPPLSVKTFAAVHMYTDKASRHLMQRANVVLGCESAMMAGAQPNVTALHVHDMGSPRKHASCTAPMYDLVKLELHHIRFFNLHQIPIHVCSGSPFLESFSLLLGCRHDSADVTQFVDNIPLLSNLTEIKLLALSTDTSATAGITACMWQGVQKVDFSETAMTLNTMRAVADKAKDISSLLSLTLDNCVPAKCV